MSVVSSATPTSTDSEVDTVGCSKGTVVEEFVVVFVNSPVMNKDGVLDAGTGGGGKCIGMSVSVYALIQNYKIGGK